MCYVAGVLDVVFLVIRSRVRKLKRFRICRPHSQHLAMYVDTIHRQAWTESRAVYARQKGEPMDLIDRQALLQALCNEDGAQHEYCYPCKTVLDVVNAQPSVQPEQQWIPCSERLPEEYEYVLLCDKEPRQDEDTGYSRMAVGWLQNGRICCWDDGAAREDFVAWMSLPEPYDAETTPKGTVYRCDPEKNTGCAKTECYIFGGDCYQTQHPEYAKEERR